MKKSELEAAAREWIAIVEAEFGLDIAPSITRRAFVAGAKYALEWMEGNIRCTTVYYPASRELLCALTKIEEDDNQSVLGLREKHGISSENRSGSKDEAEILSGKRISEKEK